MSNFNAILDHLSSLSATNRGKSFERYCKWFLENDPCYSMQLKKVWLWNNWPGSWGRDKGIDLIAETHTGEIWAIQAKAYNANYFITKEDVDKFLSESSRKKINYRLLISTTNNMGSNAQEVIKGQEKPVGICLLDSLEKSSTNWKHALDNAHTPLKKEKFSPRPHQRQALEDIVAGFDQSSNGQLYMACGTGKTLVGLWVTEALACNTTLVLVPSISLIAQLYREWANHSSNAFNFNPIFVCSDVTVSKKEDDRDEQSMMNSAELGFPVTTNAQDIVAALSRSSLPKVIFSTYHSSPVIAEACKINSSLNFDLVIADEAHRCTGSANSHFATIVDKEAIKTKRKLFMTATPKIFTDRVKKTVKDYDFDIVSMDDSDKFGPVFHQLLFSDAIKNDLLADYQVIISVIDNKTYHEYAEQGRFVSIDKHETDARTLASQLMVAKAIKKHELGHIISFHNSKKSARMFINSFSETAPLLHENERPVIHFKETIFGEMPQSERSRLLKKFKEPTQGSSALLGNVRCLSEGVDVQSLDGIAFIDPKGSEIDIIQAVGRVIRKSVHKKIGTILIPVFVDDITNEVVALEQSCFKVVWRIIKALRAHDDILAEELDSIRLELGKRTYKTPPKLSKVTIDVPEGVGVEFGEALKIKVVENCSSSWNNSFSLLKEYVDIHTNAQVSRGYKFKGFNLDIWVSTQRRSKFLNKLSQERIQKLESLPGWTWNTINYKNDEAFRAIESFVTRESHALVPTNHIENGFNLGKWVTRQRLYYSKGKLKEEFRLKLEAYPGWHWDGMEGRWERGKQLLLNFIAREGHSRVINSHLEDDFELGRWIGIWKYQYNKNTLPQWKIDFFKSLPQWSWDIKTDKWFEGFNILKQYIEREGHASVPVNHTEKKFRLGIWVRTQKYSYAVQSYENKLSEEKVTLLESIPKWSWDNELDIAWKTGYNHLRKFYEKYNHVEVPARYVIDSYNLGIWFSGQKYSFKKNSLSPERIQLLEQFPDWATDQKERRWQQAYNLLLQFCHRKGHAKVKYNHIEDDFNLGGWVLTQRKACKASKITKERIILLEKLPGWSWDTRKENDTLGKRRHL